MGTPFKMKGFSPFTKNGDVDIHKLKEEYAALTKAYENDRGNKEIQIKMREISDKVKKMHPKEFE